MKELYINFLIDRTNKSLEEELRENSTNSTEVRKLQQKVTELQGHLKDIEVKLERSTKELSKEQARNKSASKHSQVLHSVWFCQVTGTDFSDHVALFMARGD